MLQPAALLKQMLPEHFSEAVAYYLKDPPTCKSKSSQHLVVFCVRISQSRTFSSISRNVQFHIAVHLHPENLNGCGTSYSHDILALVTEINHPLRVAALLLDANTSSHCEIDPNLGSSKMMAACHWPYQKIVSSFSEEVT